MREVSLRGYTSCLKSAFFARDAFDIDNVRREFTSVTPPEQSCFSLAGLASSLSEHQLSESSTGAPYGGEPKHPRYQRTRHHGAVC